MKDHQHYSPRKRVYALAATPGLPRHLEQALMNLAEDQEEMTVPQFKSTTRSLLNQVEAAVDLTGEYRSAAYDLETLIDHQL